MACIRYPSNMLYRISLVNNIMLYYYIEYITAISKNALSVNMVDFVISAI